MIILDTNVISELMRPNPEPKVKRWIGRQKSSNLCLTTITIAEIQRGLMRLPIGKRRTLLEEQFNAFLQLAFSHRVFTFDQKAAYIYGQISTLREQSGYHVDAVDIMIASVAKHLDAKIATRNIKDFMGCGIELINPWHDESRDS